MIDPPVAADDAVTTPVQRVSSGSSRARRVRDAVLIVGVIGLLVGGAGVLGRTATTRVDVAHPAGVTPTSPNGADALADVSCDAAAARVEVAGLRVGDQQPVPSAPGDAGGTLAEAPVVIDSGARVAIALVAPACLTSSSVRLAEPVSGAHVAVDAYSRFGPVVRSEIGLDVASTVRVDGAIEATLESPAGSVTVSWPVVIRRYPILPLRFTARDQAIDLTPGCSFDIAAANEVSRSGRCEQALPDSIPALTVPPSETVRIVAPEGRFVLRAAQAGAVAVCGRAGWAPPRFNAAPECNLEDVTTLPGAPAFRVPSGDGAWIVQLTGCLEASLVRACGAWYARIDVRATAAGPGVLEEASPAG